LDNVAKKAREEFNKKQQSNKEDSPVIEPNFEKDLIKLVDKTADKMIELLNDLIGPSIDFENASFIER
jgi:hypothetical protein